MLHWVLTLWLGVAGEFSELAEPIFSRAIVAVCAEAVGAMDALLNATVDYTKQRKQFGQSISSFQVCVTAWLICIWKLN